MVDQILIKISLMVYSGGHRYFIYGIHSLSILYIYINIYRHFVVLLVSTQICDTHDSSDY